MMNLNLKKQSIKKQTHFIIKNENNIIIDTTKYEYNEQLLANKYIEKDDVVLELGARYGSVSCVINSKLSNKHNQVVIEPDSRVWNALEFNKVTNNCSFYIVKGFLSTNKHSLKELDSALGYGTTSILDTNSLIPSYTLSEIEEKYNLKFNVLVADCEGFLETFFDENPNFYNQIRMIIFEADYPNKCNYNIIKTNLKMKGFKKYIEGHQNVWIKH